MAYALNTTLYQNGKRFATFANIHGALLALESYFQLPRKSAWHFENATYKIKHNGLVVFNSENREDLEKFTRGVTVAQELLTRKRLETQFPKAFRQRNTPEEGEIK
jgi:hypothetical protein